jgi:hypothetical protein
MIRAVGSRPKEISDAPVAAIETVMTCAWPVS